MRCAGSSVLLLLLLLSLSALSTQANTERLSDNAGPKWYLTGRRAMASPVHGDERKKDEAVVARNTGANQEADHASAEVVHDQGNRRSKGSATRPTFQQGASDHNDAATVAAEMLRVDYSVYKDAHSRGPINNDAPLDDLAEKKP
uniref:Uncharacterized protein n=1 Tax=Avena sativa TaxID=4498 RepID=A0ACD5XTI9_AVESA